MESFVSHLFAAVAGGAVVWWMNRSVKRQFFLMMEAIDEGKQQDKDWKFVRDESGNPKGFKLVFGASSPTDRVGSV